MKLYEGLFIFTCTAGADAGSEQLKKLDEVLAKYEVKVLAKNDWGKRSLTHEINKEKDGHFYVFDLETKPSQIDPLRRALELHEGLLKYMITYKVVGQPAATATDDKKTKEPEEKSQTVTTK